MLLAQFWLCPLQRSHKTPYQIRLPKPVAIIRTANPHNQKVSPTNLPVSPTKEDLATTQKQQSKASEERNETIYGDSAKPDWWARIANAFIAYGTIALAIVGVMASIIAIGTLFAIQKQAKAALLSAQTMIDSERAWILVTIGSLPDVSSDTTKVAFIWIKPTVKNYGKTPARIRRIRVRLHKVAMSNGLPETLPERPEYLSDRSAEIDGKDIVLPPNVSSQPVNIGITPEELASARRGEIGVYIYGLVDYSDTVSNRPHASRFCYFFWTQSGFSPDPDGFAIAGNTPSAYIGAT